MKLDPDYVNAWKQLAANTNDPAVRDRAELNLLRLDPQRKHDSADLSTVSDLRALWAAVESTAKSIPPVPPSLYPLPASTVFLPQQRERRPARPADGDKPNGLEEFLDRSNTRLAPRAAILKNTVIDQALPLLPRNETSPGPTF